VLVDTSLLVRTLQPHHELGLLAKKAIDRLRLQNPFTVFGAPESCGVVGCGDAAGCSKTALVWRPPRRRPS
jgi:hypothetical protein